MLHTLARRDRQAGFTLIELSIVLVIIGLLIGGILKGQELINSTQVKTQVAQIDGVRAAVNTFQDKYLGLPGDYTSATSTLPDSGIGTISNGDGSGIIGTSIGNSINGAVTTSTGGSESEQFWLHMSRAGLINGAQEQPDNVIIMPGKISGAGIAATAFTESTDGGIVSQVNILRVASGTGYANQAALSALDASEMDRKYDDGLPDSGDILANGTGTSSCITGSAYRTSDGVNCLLAFRLR